MLSKFKEQFKNKKEVYLRVKVRPNSAKSEMKELMEDETIKIDIAAPPVRGRANQELTKFLACEFEVDKNNIKIISGAGDRVKLIKIKDKI